MDQSTHIDNEWRPENYVSLYTENSSMQENQSPPWMER